MEEHFDPATGEIITGGSQREQIPKIQIPGGHCNIASEWLIELADNPEWTGGEVKVIARLLGMMRYESVLLVKSAYVAKKMGRHRSGVSRTFTKLMQHGIIHKIEDVDDAYVFDPYKAWRGDSLSHLRVALAIDRKNWDEVIKNGSMARRVEA